MELRLKRVYGWNENSFKLNRVTNGEEINVVLQCYEYITFEGMKWIDVPIDEPME